MSDARIRELERAWRQSGRHEDGVAHLLALERAGRTDEVADLAASLWNEEVLANTHTIFKQALLAAPEDDGLRARIAADVRRRG